MICIIPIRSKSKGLKNKNILNFNGIPLVLNSVNLALKAKIFDKIVIATDSDNYIKFLKKKTSLHNIITNKLYFFKRSSYSSSDTAPTEIVITEVLNKFKSHKLCCLIQATSPLLAAKDLKKAFKEYIKGKFDSMFSGYIFKKFLWSKKKKLKPLNYDLFNRPMRQEIGDYFIENGAFYIFKVKKYFKYQNRLFGKIGCYKMSSKKSIDIDTKKDFVDAEKKLIQLNAQ